MNKQQKIKQIHDQIDNYCDAIKSLIQESKKKNCVIIKRTY